MKLRENRAFHKVKLGLERAKRAAGSGSWQEKLKAAARWKWSVPLLLMGAVVCFTLGWGLRPTEREEITLLTHQSYTLPAGGSLTATGTSLQWEGRELTGEQEGNATVRIGRLTEVEEYDIHIFEPEPQGEQEQRLGVDGHLALAPSPKDYPVTWSSSDNSVVTVEDGVVTGVADGTATVTETLNDFLVYTYEVTVAQPELEQPQYTVYPGDQVPVRVRYYSKLVDWKAKGKAVRVKEDGSIQAVKPGKAVLTTQIGDEELKCEVKVVALPKMETQVTLRTDETAQLHLWNALGQVKYRSADESVVSVDRWGHLTPVSAGQTSVTATCNGQKRVAQVTVNLTPEEQFRVSNYGPYQPETSVAALAMLGMCDYYNDQMKACKATWYDTNMTNFSPADTFEQAISARRKGANCNSLLNWSWHDMDIKSGHRASLYGQRDSGKIHGYNGSNRSLRSLVDKCCDVTSAHGEKTRSMERSGKLKPGDMMFMPLHTFIYRGEGTVFASAGDAKFRRKGHDLIILDCIEGSKSYDWRKRITYKMRFKDDYIPPKYRNKDGEIADNPMYLAQQQGESPWTGKRSPTERKAAGLEPVTFVLGDQEETAEEAAAQQTTPEKSTGDQSQPDSSAPAVPVTPVGEDAAAAPITGHITATIPETAVEEEVPRTVNGKPYSNHPSTGKKAKKKHKHKKSKKIASDAQNGSASVSNT